MTNVAALQRIASALDRLGGLVESHLTGGGVTFEQLATEYVSLRRTLAENFRQLAEEDLATDEWALDAIKKQVAQRMQERYGGRIPARYLQVQGYRGVHRILFEYLARHIGEPVPGSRLRLLTGDQVHTERRLRELRDLGLDLTSTRVADDDQYVLSSGASNLDYGARFVAEHNIRNDRNLSEDARHNLLDALGPQ